MYFFQNTFLQLGGITTVMRQGGPSLFQNKLRFFTRVQFIIINKRQMQVNSGKYNTELKYILVCFVYGATS